MAVTRKKSSKSDRRRPPADRVGARDLAAQVASLVSRSGGSDKAIELLMDENRRYRERHRRDSERIEELEGQLPPDDSTVLTAEEVKLWSVAKELGLKPEELKKLVAEEVPNLRREITSYKDTESISAAAGAVRYKPNVLKDLLSPRGKEVFMKKVQVAKDDGTTEEKELPHVRTKGKSDEAGELLTTFAERDLKDYLPVLRDGGKESEGTADTDGVPFFSQVQGGGDSKGKQKQPSPVDRVIGVFAAPGDLKEN